MRRVVITGVGTVSPCGADVSTTWSNISAGHSGIAKIQGFDCTEFTSQIAGECTDFDPLLYMPKRRLREAARFIQLAIAASAQAIEDAGFEPTEEQKKGSGLSSASASVGSRCSRTLARRCSKRVHDGFRPISFPP